jgi:hypothetical protein
VPITETSFAEEHLIHEAAKREDRRVSLISNSTRIYFGDIYRIKKQMI